MALTKVQIDGVEFSDSTDLNVDNGTLVVDSTNNRVGVGTTSPGSILHVRSSNALFRLESTSNTSAGVIQFGDPDDIDVGQIRYEHSDNAFRFLPNAGAAEVRIDSSGRVGIGTSSPTGKLDVAGSLGTVRVQGSGANLEFTRDGGNTILASGTNGEFFFQTGGTNTRMFISKTGNVGIGTTSPVQKMHIAGGSESVLFQAQNSSGSAFFGIRNGAYGALDTNDAYIYKDGGDITLMCEGASDVIKFAAGSSSEKVRIDSSGRLLVGTSTARTNFQLGTPTTQYETVTSTFNQGLSIINNGGSSVYFPILTLGVTRGTSIGSNTAITGANAGLGRLNFAGADGTNLLTGASITALSDGTWGSSDAPTRLEFSTTADGDSSPTERMRITSGGQVLIGTTSTPTGLGLRVDSTSSNYNEGTFRVHNHNSVNDATIASFVTASTSTSTSNVYIRFGINNYASGGGQINANGSGACAFGTFSDQRLKENIVDLPSQWENIKNLRPVEFDFIESQGGEHQIGFIAQEFETVYPDAVGSSPSFNGPDQPGGEERLTLTGWSKTEARLVKALQEAIAKIETLEQRLNDAGIA